MNSYLEKCHVMRGTPGSSYRSLDPEYGLVIILSDGDRVPMTFPVSKKKVCKIRIYKLISFSYCNRTCLSLLLREHNSTRQSISWYLSIERTNGCCCKALNKELFKYVVWLEDVGRKEVLCVMYQPCAFTIGYISSDHFLERLNPLKPWIVCSEARNSCTIWRECLDVEDLEQNLLRVSAYLRFSGFTSL